MSKKQRKAAIKIIRRYFVRAFTNAHTVRGYIREVRKRLAKFGIKNIPSKPEKFLEFCNEHNLFNRKGL